MAQPTHGISEKQISQSLLDLIENQASSLQTGYELTPAIVTNPTNGAVEIKVGSGADSDKVLIIENTAGTEVASISGQGNFEGNSFNGFQGFSTLASDLLSKLPKGTYTGTASDLETSILAISTGVQGVAITPTSTPTGTGAASWLVAESGTYTNFGGVILPVNHIGFIIRSASDVYSITSTELYLTEYVSFDDLTKSSGKNLFNKEDNSLGGHTYQNQGIDNLGVIGIYTGWVGAKIPVLENKTYSFSHFDGIYAPGDVGLLAFLDQNNSIISSIDMNGLSNSGGFSGKTLITPVGSKFIYKNVKVIAGATRDYINTFQLEEGSTVTEYISYETFVSKIKDSMILDTVARESIEINSIEISEERKKLDSVLLKIEGTKNWEVFSKGNNIYPLKSQVDFVFDLNGIGFIASDLFSLSLTVNSVDINVSGAIQMRFFRNEVSSAPSISGTASSIFTLENFTAPSVDIDYQTQLLTTNRYLHVYIEIPLMSSTILTNYRIDDISIDINNNKIYPISSGIYNPNIGDSLAFKPKLPTDLLQYEDVPTGLNYIYNALYGKKIVSIGDSMVKGHTLPSGSVWDALLSSRNGMINVNYGINGTQITNNNAFGLSVLNRYLTMDNDADFVAVFGGTNDAESLVPLGLDTDSYSGGQETFKGAMNDLCIGLLNKYPDKKIFFITPYNRSINTQNYITAILTVCKKYSIPVFDNWTSGSLSWSNSAQIASLTLNDTYHLNELGMLRASEKYEYFMRAL